MIRHIACAGMIAFYLLLKFVLARYLSDKFFVDSEKMFRILEEGKTEGSFASTARLYAMLPPWSHDLIVAGIALTCIVLTFKAVRTWRGIYLAGLVLTPLLVLGILVPTKETIVLLMSFIILAVSRLTKKKKELYLFAAIVVLYAAYGAGIRIYYLLILGVWLAFLLAPRVPKAMTVLLCLAGFAALFVLPSDVFDTLQGPRDTVYRFVQLSPSSNIRTVFHNPFTPDNPFAFIGNYLYAIVLLHFPFFHSLGIKELLMFLNILAYGWLTWKGWTSDHPKTVMLAKLFSAHLVILWLFEPDLGSYFRHFSSVFPYLLPALLLVERQKAPVENLGKPESKMSSNFVRKPETTWIIGAGKIEDD